MKPFICYFLLLVAALRVEAGGPSIESNHLKVGKITTTAEEIVMQIDGHFSFATLKTPAEDQKDGNGKMVSLIIQDGILRISKKKWKHPGGDEFEVYLDWEQYRKEIIKWEGKEIFTQMWFTEIILKGGSPREIVAEVCQIWPKKK